VISWNDEGRSLILFSNDNNDGKEESIRLFVVVSVVNKLVVERVLLRLRRAVILAICRREDEKNIVFFLSVFCNDCQPIFRSQMYFFLITKKLLSARAYFSSAKIAL